MSEDQSNIVTLKVRVTAEFREKIATTAKENNRSMNAEIVARLERSFADLTQDPEYANQLINVKAIFDNREDLVESIELMEKYIELTEKIEKIRKQKDSN